MKRFFKLLPVLLVAALCFTGCFGDSVDPDKIDYKTQLLAPEEGDDIAVFETSLGKVVVQLYTDEVPTIVQNFKDLINKGFFDGQIIFHVEKQYAAVAFGSPDRDGASGDSNTGKPIKIEYSDNLWPISGSLCTLTYETGQFFNKGNYFDSRSFFVSSKELSEETLSEMDQYSFPVMLTNIFKEMGGVPEVARYYSVFGKVIQGQDVVDSIMELEMETVMGTGEYEGTEVATRPTEDVIIEKVTLDTFRAADYETLDNTLTAQEFQDLSDRSAKEQAEKEAAQTGSSASTGN